VGHDDHRHAVLGELDHDIEDLVDHLGVQRAGRLVEEHDLRMHREGARDGHALLLAAGELSRELGCLLGDADALEQRHRLLLGLRLGLAEHLDRPERHILEDRQVREEVERLEDHADLGPQLGKALALRGQGLAVDADLAAGDRLEPVDGAAQRRLARAGRPDDDDDLALVDLQVDVFECVEFAVMLLDILDHHEGVSALCHGSQTRSEAVGPAVTARAFTDS